MDVKNYRYIKNNPPYYVIRATPIQSIFRFDTNIPVYNTRKHDNQYTCITKFKIWRKVVASHSILNNDQKSLNDIRYTAKLLLDKKLLYM